MPVNADGSPGSDPSGATLDSAAVQKLIDDAVGKALAARLPRVKNTEETLAKMVAEAIAKLTPAEKPAEAPVPGNPAESQEQKLTLKALEEKHKALEAKLVAADKARLEAETRARDARVRAEVQQRFAAKLGADNPALGLLMDSFYDVKKRVIEKDGSTFVRFKSQYGDEDDLRPLEDAVGALFAKDGELHHMVAQPSRAPSLPPGGIPRQMTGAIPQAIPQGQPGAGRPNPIYEVAAAHYLSQGEHGIAQSLATDAVNGTSRK